MAINESIKKAAAEALAAINQYDRKKFTHGTDRIRLYYSDIDGDWLNEFQENHTQSISAVQIAQKRLSENPDRRRSA